MKSPVLTIDFFHDAVCGWCFVMSPKLRKLAAEIPIRVHHRTFVLQDSPAKLADAFGSVEKAKDAILDHWQRCGEHDDSSRINVEGMRRQPFPYPTGLQSQSLQGGGTAGRGRRALGLFRCGVGGASDGKPKYC